MRGTFTRRGLSAGLSLAAIVAACSPGDRETAPRLTPEFAISDAGNEGGTPGFFFLPPMVAQPLFSGTFDADIATLNPQIAICDVTNGPDASCGGTGGTPAVIVFTTASTPAITLDPTTPQYQVNWSTKGAGFIAGHTYRVHVTAGANGARRELGFADVLLTTMPGQAKRLAPGDIIVLQVGRTLPIHFRIEVGIPGRLAVSAATPSVTTGGTDLITATVQDLRGALLAGATVAWSLATTPPTGVADATQPLNPTDGQTGTAGTTATTFKAGTTSGTALVSGTSTGLSATVSITATACVTPPSNLISWWPGDGSANDIHGSNQGTLQNGATFGPGKVGQAFLLDGVDDFVDLGTSSAFDFGSADFTIEFWIFWNSLAGEQVMIEKWDNGPAFGGTALTGWTLTKLSSNQFQFGGAAAGNYASVNVTPPEIGSGVWHHVAVTRSSGLVTVHWDGASIGTVIVPNIDATPQSLKLGRRSDSRGFFHNGLIDEVSIYSRALGAAEIQAIFNAGSAGKCKL